MRLYQTSLIQGQTFDRSDMITHHPRVGLDVPIEVSIYRPASLKAHLAVDLSSSQMSRLHHEGIYSAALKRDARLRALTAPVTGAFARHRQTAHPVPGASAKAI
jgi:hypothetical protein